MKTGLHKIITAIFCSITLTTNAQTDTAKSKPGLKFGTYYNSHLNYYGRTDSLRSSGFFPMAELWLKRVYINAAPVFTNNSAANFQYAGTVVTAGYLYNSQKSSIHIYLVKPIYKNNSQLVQSALKAQLAGSYTWFNKVLNLTAGADIKLSDNIDYGAGIGLDHIFKKVIANNIVLVVDPAVNVYAGTQRFIQTRYEKKDFLVFPDVEQAVTKEIDKISILSYELSMPVICSKGKWMLLVTPAYVLPQNLVTISGRPDLSERGKKMFYITAGAKLTL